MAARLHSIRPLLGISRVLKGIPPCIANIQAQHNRLYSQVLQGKTVKVGCASGFWGDTAVSAPQLIYGNRNIDFLVFDYLSEITMSLMTAAKHKNPEFGYAPDFVQVSLAAFVKDIKKKGIRVISNAGGVNPEACARALHEVCKKEGVDLKIAVVTGDDLMPKLGELHKMGVTEMQSGMSLPKTVHSMNVYLGAGPIVKALELGADVVITGRCVDSALVLAPLVHSFGWKMDSFDELAAGSLAGHLVECGAQTTGGIFTDWHLVNDWANIGFPIVDCSADGSFVVCKHSNTGGLINTATVGEQLLYEIGDPARYFLPDVVADFSNVTLQNIPDHDGGAGVLVKGAKGSPPTGELKVSATYADGFRATAVAPVGGPRAKAKAEKTANEIIKRCRRIFKQLHLKDFTAVRTEILGSEQNYGPNSKLPEGSREAVLWLAAHHQEKKALEFFAREVAPAGTGMAPGLTGIVGGRPRVSPVLKLFSFLYPRDDIKVDIKMDETHCETYTSPSVPTKDYSADKGSTHSGEQGEVPLPTGPHTFRLEDLAYTRSGDKGNMANIGVIARHPDILPYLKKTLTAEAVDEYFSYLFEDRSGPLESRVERFDVPGISGLNFVLHNSLGGGGIASLRSDPQGKAFGQILLDFEVKNVPDLVQSIQK